MKRMSPKSNTYEEGVVRIEFASLTRNCIALCAGYARQEQHI